MRRHRLNDSRVWKQALDKWYVFAICIWGLHRTVSRQYREYLKDSKKRVDNPIENYFQITNKYMKRYSSRKFQLKPQ
jgi:hypothetical protein